MSDRGWSAASAGAMVTAAQVLGAGGRIAAGRWSDMVGSRLRPIRTIALAAAAAMGLLALTGWLDSPISVAVMVVASVITVSDNGLAFTAIAEIAGPFWSGRALGTQNTSQLLTAGVAPPLFGGLIGVAGYPVAFAVCALFPLIAMPLVPVDAEPDRPAVRLTHASRTAWPGRRRRCASRTAGMRCVAAAAHWQGSAACPRLTGGRARSPREPVPASDV